MGRSLLLRLEAPSQSWDARRFRATMSRRPLSRALDPVVLAPTRTGIEGLLRAALGDTTDLSGLDVVVRADQEGRARVEFRTSRRTTPAGVVQVVVFGEHVLDDGRFTVGVFGDDALIGRLVEALRCPARFLALGKREYPPARPVLDGVVDGGADAAVRAAPWSAAGWWRARDYQDARLRVYRPLLRPRHDDPVVELADEHIANPVGRVRPAALDWLAALSPPGRG